MHFVYTAKSTFSVKFSKIIEFSKSSSVKYLHVMEICYSLNHDDLLKVLCLKQQK